MSLHTIHSNRVGRALHVLAVVIVASVALAGMRVVAGPIRDTTIAPSADAQASPDVQPSVGADGVVPPGLDNALFNVSTKFYLDGATIALGPNLTTADVVWNVASGATFGTHGNNTFRGIVLAPYTGGTIFDLGPADGMFVGGYNQLVTLMSGTHVTAPTAPPPTVVNTATATVTVSGSTLTATDTATVTLDK